MKKINLYTLTLGDKSCRYYLDRFAQFEQRKSNFRLNWNWEAFLLTAVWALYRKMYGWFLLFCGIFSSVIVFGIIGWIELSLFVLLSSAFSFGLFANLIYFNSIKKKIASAMASSLNNEAVFVQILREQGGVNPWASGIFIIFLITGGWFGITHYDLHLQPYPFHTVTAAEKKYTVTEQKQGLHRTQTTDAGLVSEPSITDAIDRLFSAQETATVEPTSHPILTKKEAASKPELMQKLTEEATAFNQQASTVSANAEIQKEKMEVSPDLRVTTYYSFPQHSRREIKPSWIAETLKTAVKKSACKRTFQYGTRYVYVYKAKDGRKVARFEIKKQDCRVLSPPKVHFTSLPPIPKRKKVIPDSKPYSINNVSVQRHPQNLITEESTAETPCQIKAVMTNEDYVACHITPPMPPLN